MLECGNSDDVDDRDLAFSDEQLISRSKILLAPEVENATQCSIAVFIGVDLNPSCAGLEVLIILVWLTFPAEETPEARGF